MNLHTIFLSVLLSLLCGCLQTFNTSVSPIRDVALFEPAHTISSRVSEKKIKKIKSREHTNSNSEETVSDSQNKKYVPSESFEKTADIKKAEPENDTEAYENSPPNSILDEALDFCEAAQELWEKGELDNALDTLDQAYSLIIEVDTDDNPKLIQQKEDLRFMISKRILEIYASRHIIVNGKHNAIPMVINKYVQAEIDSFTKNGKCKNDEFFVKAYNRSGKYRPYILEEFKKAGLPAELSWLPLIESGFNVYALSPARALGLWQFIQSTGAKFGLKRDRYIDERLNTEKATKAAIAYLKELHQMFGDWTTVLAAYNCGEGRVLRVIREQNLNYLDNFWDLYERLPRETARYVPRFLATLLIVNNPEKYGLSSVTPCSPLEYETMTISKQVHLKDVAKMIGTSQESLRELNPELRYNIVPSPQYSLRIPSQTGDILLSKIDDIPVVVSPPIPAKQKKNRVVKYHKVKKGETLSDIAKRYRISVRDIRHVNRINKKGYIVAGKTLKIQTKYTSEKSDKREYIRISKHMVKRGDSLWNIASRYGTTTKKIRSLNNLPNSKLHIGQSLKIPGRDKSGKKARDLRTYQVKRGDVPREIARRYNMPLDRFLRVNHLTQRSKIYPGQKLYVD